MIKWFCVILAGALSLLSARADEPKLDGSAPRAEVSPASQAENAEKMKRLMAEVDRARSKYLNATDQHNPSETEAAWKDYRTTNDQNLPILFNLAAKFPASDEAFRAFTWIAANGRIDIPALKRYGDKAISYLRDFHTKQPDTGPVCVAIAKHWDASFEPAMDFLRRVAEQNHQRASRGFALAVLARLTQKEAEEISLNTAIAFANGLTNASLSNLGETNQSAVTKAAEAEALYHRVITEYGDCPVFDDSSSILGEKARVRLREIQRLSIGKEAPELEGIDLAGKPMKLSDFRGKVVVVSFWATWCGPCMQMVPHENALVNRMQGKPFVLVGVNGDDDKERARKAVEQHQIQWPSFGDGDMGPLSVSWNVTSWPTVYVIDHKGVIRLKCVYGKRIEDMVDNLVDRLIKEMDESL